MKILLVSAHPVEDSYNAALRQAAMAALQHAGHEVDHLDLYAEGFDPVLGRAERLGYHEVSANCALVEAYVTRLLAVRRQHLWDPIGDLNNGGLLIHRNPKESEDEP